MKKIIKTVIKKGFNLCGFDIQKYHKWHRNKYLWLDQFSIRTVFDIGANRGQFVEEIIQIFPNAAIYSFEPLDDCFKELQKKMMKNHNLKAFKFGLGDFNGEMNIHSSEFSPSSSILEMADLHKKLFPHTQKTNLEKIAVRKLDDFVHEQNLEMKSHILIKMDVQGYEDQIIKGGSETISKARLIIAETSFVELYKNQILFDGIYSTLRNFGFIFIGNLSQLNNPLNGKPIQADSVFLKN